MPPWGREPPHQEVFVHIHVPLQTKIKPNQQRAQKAVYSSIHSQTSRRRPKIARCITHLSCRSVHIQPLALAGLQLGTLAHRPNLQLTAVSLQDALIVVFPEGLRGVLAGESLEDLGAAGVFLEEVCGGWGSAGAWLGVCCLRRGWRGHW